MTCEYKVGEWYKTRGGHEAQVLDVNFNSVVGLTILGKIKYDDCEMVYSWTRDGRYSTIAPTGFDLLPPVGRKELWVNVYNSYLGSNAWSSKELADKHAEDDRADLLRIVIEGDDCTAEKVTG
jgi:hypothetical protein